MTSTPTQTSTCTPTLTPTQTSTSTPTLTSPLITYNLSTPSNVGSEKGPTWLSSPDGDGSGPAPGGSYNAGDSVDITFNPDSNSDATVYLDTVQQGGTFPGPALYHYNGGVFVMNADHEFKATWHWKRVNYTLGTTGTGTGGVSSPGFSSPTPYRDKITVQATARPGSVFVQWTNNQGYSFGDANNPITAITSEMIAANTTITAEFALE